MASDTDTMASSRLVSSMAQCWFWHPTTVVILLVSVWLMVVRVDLCVLASQVRLKSQSSLRDMGELASRAEVHLQSSAIRTAQAAQARALLDLGEDIAELRARQIDT